MANVVKDDFIIEVTSKARFRKEYGPNARRENN